jgi:hypothetical protein
MKPCDFCNEPAGWCYDVAPTATRQGDMLVCFTSHSGIVQWWACDECERLIASGRRAELHDRAVSSRLRAFPIDRAAAVAVRALHDDFWRSRLQAAPAVAGGEA